MERFHSSKQQVSSHGIETGSSDFAKVIDFRYQIGGAAYHSSERIGVPAEELCGAVNHEIGAEFYRLLIDGRGKCVVHNYTRAPAMGCGSQTAEVDNFDSWIRRALQVHHLAPLANRRFDGLVVGRIAERNLDAESRQEFRS